MLAARAYLRDHGPASRRELVHAVMPVYSVGYDVPDPDRDSRYRGGWWRSVVKPGLESFSDVSKPDGGGKWSLVTNSK